MRAVPEIGCAVESMRSMLGEIPHEC
jgi:hypothetical protein